MPYTLPPITLTENVTSLVNIPGNLGSVTYLKMVNASPYLLTVNNLLGGSDYMQPGEANIWPVPGLSTAVQVTPLQFVSSVNSPSSTLVVTWYLQGEQPGGSYPVNFNSLFFNGGNVGTANQLINTGNAPAVTVIQVEEQGGTGNNLYADNAGTLIVGALSNNIYTQLITVTPGGNSFPAELVLRLLLCVGPTQLDGGSIVTDGNGNMTTKILTATAPVTLAAGNQETGMCGGTGQTAAVNLFIDMPINFKTVLTNTPTSITFVGLQTGNANAPSADTFHIYGCRMFWQAPATGQTSWIGSYTTVGNCLLAVDSAARTFDFHCDTCKATHAGLPLSTARSLRETDLSVVCPNCGASEAFDTHLTAADEADSTPQGSGDYATTRGAQATLIRQLMTALGLEVAA